MASTLGEVLVNMLLGERYATVNHQSGVRGGVAGIYNRSQLLPEREEAFRRWALHLAGMVEPRPANVTKLRRRPAQ
jgi:hypothetical protein